MPGPMSMAGGTRTTAFSCPASRTAAVASSMVQSNGWCCAATAGRPLRSRGTGQGCARGGVPGRPGRQRLFRCGRAAMDGARLYHNGREARYVCNHLATSRHFTSISGEADRHVGGGRCCRLAPSAVKSRCSWPRISSWSGRPAAAVGATPGAGCLRGRTAPALQAVARTTAGARRARLGGSPGQTGVARA
jgi:hypothetical protein